MKADAVVHLMKQYRLQGVWLGKGKIITNSQDDHNHINDLIDRNFSAYRPNFAKQCLSVLQISPISRQLVAGLYHIYY